MRILYIEDNEANLTLVRKVLEASGATVEGATTGEEGLTWLAHSRPDLVLLDLDLPGISGFEVATIMAADPKLASIPIVAISASVMKRERDQALAAGCLAFIEKPFDIGRLRSIVAAAVAGELPRTSSDE
jgi:two-component system cell cycle response regulator DivK